ncbi:MAG: DNA polymerase III subunit gamma/tau [Candidatus Dormiibacterota bacterium]
MNSVRQTLYLKYRPQRFADLVGQEVVAQTLRNSVRENRLSHAYLFTGIHGTGKTSAARILAKAINCEAVEDGEPCGKCGACVSIAGQRCLDVIEIDAATNRGIDEIRDLRERAQFLPSQFKTKVYIIDEAHMLSVDAANAFLKTLEEPPEHACFILATTEPQKLADTVLSRCQRFDFRRIPLDAMAAHMARICTAEGVAASPDALTLVAEAGAGSLRDAFSLLDRLLGLAGGQLDREAVQAGLGMADPRALVRLARALGAGEMGLAWTELSQLQAGGVEPRQLIRALGALAKLYLWQELGGAPGISQPDLEEVPAPPGFWLEVMTMAAATGTELRRADDPWMSVEASLLRLCRYDMATVVRAEPAPVPAPLAVAPTPPAPPQRTVAEVSQPPVEEKEAEVVAPALPSPAAEPVEEEPPAVAEPPGEVASADSNAIGRWPEILAWLGRENLPVQALVKEGRPASYQDGVLTIEFDPKYEFHRGMAASAANRALLQRACLEVLGAAVVVVVVSSAGSAAAVSSNGAGPGVPDGEAKSTLSQALAVFPGSRVTRLGTSEKRQGAGTSNLE